MKKNLKDKLQKINFKNKKFLLVLVAVLVIIIVVILTQKGTDKSVNHVFNKSMNNNVNIVKSEANNLKLVNYNGGNFTMKIPKGWTVETGGVDMFYAIRVYNPKDNRYQIYAILKAEPFLKNDKAKQWFRNYYSRFGGEQNRVLAEAIVLYQPTVEAFYSSFNDYAKYTKSVDTIYDTFNFPDLKNFAMVESFESNSSMKSVSKDDKTLRGTFQDSKTLKKGEGLFMASLVDVGSYMATGFDTYPYSAYNIMGITTGENDLVNYQALLTQSLGSIKYTDSFVNTTIKNGNEKTKTVVSMNQSLQDAFNSYNDAWSNRQKTYDITNQKYSDATLGYERVYDTKTGDIYKAYNGFSDDYSGNRYKTATDDMYTKSVNGYIEK